MSRESRSLNGRKPGGRIDSLQDILCYEIHDLLLAEDSMRDLIPEICRRTTHAELAVVIDQQAGQSHAKSNRYTQILETLGSRVSPPHGSGAEPMLTTVLEVSDLPASPLARDTLLVSFFRRFQHYQISGLGNALALAEQMKDEHTVDLLHESLQEAEMHDTMLFDLANELLHQEMKRSAGD